MRTANISKDLSEYQNKLRLFLADKYENGSLKLAELLAILEICSGHENSTHFNSIVELFSKSFPILKEFLDEDNKKTSKKHTWQI